MSAPAAALLQRSRGRAAQRSNANRKNVTRYVEGQLHSALRNSPHCGTGSPAPHCGISQANKQTNKQTRRPTSKGMRQPTRLGGTCVDHSCDALEATLAEQRLDVQPIARVAEAAAIKASRIMQQPCHLQHALYRWPSPSLFQGCVSPKDGSAAVALSGLESKARGSGVGFRMCLFVPLPFEDAEEVLADGTQTATAATADSGKLHGTTREALVAHALMHSD